MLVQDPDLPYPYQFPEPAKTPRACGTLRVGVTFDVANFDPSVSSAGGTITVPNMVYNRLLGFVGGPSYDPFNLELEPELASAWERTPDGGTFTFQIRDDINWQNIAPLNGRKFVAADAKYAHDRYAQEGAHKSYWTNISSTESVDDQTLKINMATVTADFILPLAGRYQTIFPRELVDDGTIDTRSVGTGPMILTGAEQGQNMTFDKNPDFWERDVLLDGVHEFRRHGRMPRRASPRSASGRSTTGTRSGIRSPAARRATRYEPRCAGQPDPGGIGLDVRHEPVQPEVRGRTGAAGRSRLAIDSGLIRDVDLRRLRQVAHAPATLVSTPSTKSPPSRERAAGPVARALQPGRGQEAAGGIRRAGPELRARSTTSYGGYITQFTEILLSNFANVGIEMGTNSVDYTEFNSTWIPRKLEEASTSAWQTAGFDTDNYFFNSVHSESAGNRWNLNDPQVDEWALAQQSELDPDARKAIIRQMWDYFLDQMYWPPLASGIGTSVYQPWLRGFRFGGPNTTSSYYYDWGDQIASAWLDK